MTYRPTYLWRIRAQLKILGRRVLYRRHLRSCPCCGAQSNRYLPFGKRVRREAKCPGCGSLERHRLIALFFLRCTDLFDGREKHMLHFAPEAALSHTFRSLTGMTYLSSDLEADVADTQVDITQLPFPDSSFDIIYCSHVLEHVPDDRKAMREIRRVLRPSGWAVLQVPIKGRRTYEDWSITAPEDRQRVFGQSDHVRFYGNDFSERLTQQGFQVMEDSFASKLPLRELVQFGITPQERIYLCRK